MSRFQKVVLVGTSLIAFLYVAFVSASTASENEDESSAEGKEYIKFIPSNEWQIVKPRHILPPGLHIRMNLQTGLKEAKLMDDDPKRTQLAKYEESDEIAPSSASREIVSTAEALKNIKDEQPHNLTESLRNYTQLKEELKELNIEAKSDSELLAKLLDEYKLTAEYESETLRILEDLEYLVHQYDNAIQFADQKGLEEILFKNFNSSSANIRSSSLKLLGSAARNNIKVQIKALEVGAVDILLRLLSTEQDGDVKNHAIFALSSVLGEFPLAQLKFVKSGGLHVLCDLLRRTESPKTTLKIITLINDLVEDGQGESGEKGEQYKQIELKARLEAMDWCVLLLDALREFNAIEDLDGIEKCLVALNSTKDICVGGFDDDFARILSELETRYKQLAESDTDSEYYTSMYELTTKITHD